jgi:hypothetical protein
LRGRFLTEQEVNARIHTMAVNQAFEKRYFAGGHAIG